MAARDVSLDDWRTFVNFLVPDFAAARNERLVDRKLRAEMMSEAAEEVRSQAETEAAVAQIEGLRIGSSPRQQVVDVGVAEATVREWNEGFFAPRGVVVRLDTLSGGGGNKNEDGGMQVPGAWDTSFDREAGTAAAGPSTVPANGARSRFARLNPFSSSGGNNNTGGGGNGAFRFGGITVDGDRLSIGDRFVADRNGLRIGGIVADGNGITLHGQPMFGAGPMAGGHHGGFGPGGPFGGVRGGPGMCGPRGTPPWGAGGPRGGFGHGPWGGRGGGGIWGGVGAGGAPQDYDDAAGACGGRGRRGGRGRGRHNGKGRQRSRSSSVSSQSSSSSSSSESSVGSLPEYEDLRDPQLGVARERLQQWLRDPNQPITRAKVKALREEIKQAKTNESLVPGDTDRNALRKEVKALLKEWKGLKKQQSKANKQIRRERRQKRREEKRERRSVRREMRRAERDWRRGRGHHQHPHPHAPPPHGMPGAFPFPFGGAPHVPPVPPVPGAAPGLFGPRGGLGNLFGGAGGGPAGPGPAGPSRTPPGAWPQENLDTLGPSHRASQAKYRAAEGLEKQIAAKEAELLRVHEAIARGEEEARNRGSGSDNKNQGGGDHKIQTPAETNAFRLETEIEALGRSMAQLRTEADEEFARELAEEEQRRAW
ncbi:hypothetical protein QBC47DRAFT_377834 [Echria macrotheca]|uniref:Uncharacterized protein n=1 Tax=Echria macrotheca TaxID=438768 RepID=A0AAJ0BFC0_9PEZI|nr:hypothetical protein QBC47DRAFT_377834 [Echria macrotheca]